MYKVPRMYKRMGGRRVVNATPPPSHIALLIPKNVIFINELYWEYNVYACFGSLLLQFALLFQNGQT